MWCLYSFDGCLFVCHHQFPAIQMYGHFPRKYRAAHHVPWSSKDKLNSIESLQTKMFTYYAIAMKTINTSLPHVDAAPQNTEAFKHFTKLIITFPQIRSVAPHSTHHTNGLFSIKAEWIWRLIHFSFIFCFVVFLYLDFYVWWIAIYFSSPNWMTLHFQVVNELKLVEMCNWNLKEQY